MTTLALTSLPFADSSYMHGGWGWAWMVPVMLGMALVWGAIILGIVWLVRDGVQRRQAGPEEAALTILDRRFAEGTLSPDDYHQRKHALAGEAAPRPDRGGRSGAVEGTWR